MPDETIADISALTGQEISVLEAYLSSPLTRIDGFQMRIFARMGDRIGVGLTKLIFPLGTLSGHLQSKVTSALRIAFGSPEAIDNELDRRPAVVLLLLDALEARAESEDERRVLRAVRDEIAGVAPQ